MVSESFGVWDLLCDAPTTEQLVGLDGDVESLHRLRERRHAQLVDVLTRRDPMLIVSAACAEVHSARAGRTSQQMYGSDARLQYLSGVYASLSYGFLPRPDESHARAAMSFVRDLFQIDQRLIDLERQEESSEYRLATIRAGVRLELLEDRFVCYPVVLEEIMGEVLDGVREAFATHFDWPPEYLLAIIWAAWELERMGSAKMAEFGWSGCGDFSLRTHLFTADELAEAAGLQSSDVISVMNEIAWDQVSMMFPAPGRPSAAVRFPQEPNELVWRGAIAVGPDRWLIPTPGAWFQYCLTTIERLCQAASPKLERNWFAAQQGATEHIVERQLARTFTPNRCFPNLLHLDGIEQGESDLIVDLSGDVLLVESKAVTLGSAGRRADRNALSKKLQEIPVKGSRQVEKGRTHLSRPGHRLRSASRRDSELSFELDTDALLPGVVVSFNRVDPMETWNEVLGDAHSPLMALADFVAVCQALRWPSHLWNYLVQRRSLALSTSVKFASEMDPLGYYLMEGTLAPWLQYDLAGLLFAANFGERANRAFSSATIEAAVEERPPGPPIAVVDALTDALLAPSKGWATAALAIHARTPEWWSAALGQSDQSTHVVSGEQPARITVSNSVVVEFVPASSHAETQVVGSLVTLRTPHRPDECRRP